MMDTTLPRVVAVETLGGRRVRLTFSDTVVRDVDLTPLLWGPVFERIAADDEAFAQVFVDEQLGTIAWPGDVELDPDVLYGTYPPAPSMA